MCISLDLRQQIAFFNVEYFDPHLTIRGEIPSADPIIFNGYLDIGQTRDVVFGPVALVINRPTVTPHLFCDVIVFQAVVCKPIVIIVSVCIQTPIGEKTLHMEIHPLTNGWSTAHVIIIDVHFIEGKGFNF